MIEGLTSPERVLYRATYDFAIKVEGLTHEQAKDRAIEKINSKRSLANKLTYRY